MAQKITQLKSMRANGEIETITGAWNDSYQPPVPMVYLNSLIEYSNFVIKGTMLEPAVKEAILLSHKLYMFGGLMSTILDMQIRMANTPFSIFTDNPKLNTIVERWLTFLNYNNRRTLMGQNKFSEEFYHDFLICGNVFPYEAWEQYKVDGKSYFLPMQIKFLNPLCIRMYLDNGVTEKIYYYNLGDWSLGTSLINNKQSVNMEVRPNNMKRIARNSTQYKLWGIPYLMKAFKDLASKQRLKQLDDVTTQGLITMMTLFSLYNEKEGINAKQSTVDAFNAMLKSRPEGALYLTWGGPVNGKSYGPNGEILKFSEKYTEVDKDLCESLGIPNMLISGDFKGGVSGADMAIKPLKTNLEQMQETKSNWLIYAVDKIARLNNLEYKKINVLHAGVNLDDDATLTAMMNNMRDRGVISNTSYALKLRANAQMEEFMLAEEEEKKKDPKYVFGRPAETPYQGQASLPGAAGKGKPSIPGTQGKDSPKNGRPANSDPESKVKDSVKKVKDSAKKKMELKGHLADTSASIRDGLISYLENDKVEQQDKFAAPLVDSIRVANIYTEHLRAAVDSAVANEFFEESIKKANEMSLDIQQMLVKNKLDVEAIKANFDSLAKDLYKDYEAKLRKSEYKAEETEYDKES